MIRRFRQHHKRRVTDLEGVWDFVFLGDTDPASIDVGALQYPDRMAVPGCFDATPRYAGKRGLVAYRTRVHLADDTPHRLSFGSVHHWCRVFVGGRALRDHRGGFTPFAVDITGHGAGETEIVVLVDNRMDEVRSPLHRDYVDWYHYGGIARGVELHRLGTLWLDRVTIVTEDVATRRINVAITYGATVPPGQSRLTISCEGRVVLDECVTLSDTCGHVAFSLELAGAALWSPDEPNLHHLHVHLGDDDMLERIGIRQVRVDGRQILINGELVRLLGFNRHEAHPQFGHGLPDGLLIADLQQLQDMGCNFVRGSHYPQDPRFLDLCDEAGLCVWSEAIGWQHTADHLTEPHFVQAQLDHIDEMVASACNRPSVIMWGILNESDSHDPACRPAYETLLGRLRTRDPSRPVSYATHRPFEDICLDLVDIVAINRYPGWYQAEIEDIPAELDQVIDHLDRAGQADKPLIVSEIGAGAIPGWRDWNEARWTEQYQARLLEAVIRYLFRERDRVCGLAIWQFCDLRASPKADRMMGRPRGFNNKGVVDEYRRPKLAYDLVKQLFRQLRQL
jgi:beta-glucuronidase